MAKGLINFEKFESREMMRSHIQYLAKQGRTVKEIIQETSCDRKTVLKWMERNSCETKERKEYFRKRKEIIAFIKESAKSKSTTDGASTRKIAQAVNFNFPVIDSDGNPKETISHRGVAKILRKLKIRPMRVRCGYRLTPEHKQKRVEFIQTIREQGITGRDIFFTDEKVFTLRIKANSQTNRVYLSESARKKIKEGDYETSKLLEKDKERHEASVMVSAGISWWGVGKLIYFIGNGDGKNYSDCLDYFAEDLEILSQKAGKQLLFQQDNASPHTCHISMNKIGLLFGDEKTLIKWPAKSADISPIELLWATIDCKLHQKEFSNLNEMIYELEDLWNRIPVSLCRSIIDQFDFRCEQVLSTEGNKFNKLMIKQEESKKTNENRDFSVYWNVKHEDEIERIVINDSYLEKVQKKVVKVLNRKLIKSQKVFKKLDKDAKKASADKKHVDVRNSSKFASKNPILNNLLNSRFQAKNDNSKQLLDDHKKVIEKIKFKIKYVREQNIHSFKNELNIKDKENLIGNSIVSYKTLSSLSTVASSIK